MSNGHNSSVLRRSAQGSGTVAIAGNCSVVSIRRKRGIKQCTDGHARSARQGFRVQNRLLGREERHFAAWPMALAVGRNRHTIVSFVCLACWARPRHHCSSRPRAGRNRVMILVAGRRLDLEDSLVVLSLGGSSRRALTHYGFFFLPAWSGWPQHVFLSTGQAMWGRSIAFLAWPVGIGRAMIHVRPRRK